MPAGMVLKSEPFASNLWDPKREFTLERFTTERKIPYKHSGRPLSLADFLSYAEWFQQRAVGEPNPAKVQRISRSAGEFTLEFAGHPPIKARRVILATGHMAFRYIPQELAANNSGVCAKSAMRMIPRTAPTMVPITRYKLFESVMPGDGCAAIQTVSHAQWGDSS
jgi:hypothetical protein